MKHEHLFDPKHIAVLEAKDRKIWQSPDAILNAVEVKPDFVVADLGCGSGYFTVPLAEKAKKVYAIDVQKEMLNFLEEKIKHKKIRNIQPMLSKPNRIPLGSQSVDLLLSVNTLHEFENREKMITEMRRVLKKDGQLLIVDFKREETGFGPPVKIRVSKTRAVELFKSAGFELSKVKDLPYHYLLVFSKQS